MTTEPTFKRARQPEQIQQRRQDILQAAEELMAEHGFEQVSLNAIARNAGVAKSNIYRYFESREEIFLILLRQDWTDWLDQVEIKAAVLKGTGDIDALCHLIANSIASRPRMCALVSVLASVLEHNISESAVLIFKRESLELGKRIVQLIWNVVPSLPKESLLALNQTLFALISGLWPLGNPTPVVEKVISRPELTSFRVDFETALERALNSMMKGASKA